MASTLDTPPKPGSIDRLATRLGPKFGLTEADTTLLWHHMRVPVLSFVALMLLLAAIVLLGALLPSSIATYIEVALTITMIAVVLLFSMEVREESPLARFFSLLGFAWVLVLFGMTLVDYLSR